jgi:hypothetical protein
MPPGFARFHKNIAGLRAHPLNFLHSAQRIYCIDTSKGMRPLKRISDFTQRNRLNNYRLSAIAHP